MSPSFIPAIHDLAHLSIPETETMLAQALALKTAQDIHRLMDDYVLHLRPELSPLLIA